MNPTPEPQPSPPQDGAAWAVISHQIGEIKHALEAQNTELNRRLDDHSHRIGALEEHKIRLDEREKTEDRLRKLLAEERVEQAHQASTRATFKFSRAQIWIALIGLLVFAISAGASLAALLH